MSKALVIRGANFAENKVTTIELQEIIPCTGITLSTNEASLTNIGGTVQLTASVTPIDTTDPVIWTTSDAECATVENGLVTSVGIGTATITATCGTYSATCVVSVSVTVDAMTAYDHVDGFRYSGSVNIAQNKNHIGRIADAAGRIFYDTTKDYSGNNRVFYYDADRYYDIFNTCWGIMIPKGTSKITVDTNGVTCDYLTVIAGNSAVRANSFSSSARPNFAAVAVTSDSGSMQLTKKTLDITSVKDTADVFVIMMRANSGDPTTLEHVYVTFE